MGGAEPISLSTWSALSAAGWEILAIAALAAFAGTLVVRRTRSGLLTAALRIAVASLALIATFGYFSLSVEREQAAEWRAFKGRQTELATQALAPASPLACLDDAAGEVVQTACEKSIFLRPETVAAAVSYMAARLSLLSDASRYAALGDAQFAAQFAGLRRAVELDRYGLAAHVLATRDGCSADACPAFALVEDATALKANLRARAFNGYVDRYAALWAKADDKPAEKGAPPAEVPQASAAPPAPAPGPSFAGRYDFPSAASIPAVSIMNSEPPRPPEAALAPSAADPQDPAAAVTPLPPKRPLTQSADPR
jgi:hypothetical protein